jgi:[FeFe] hydrogenase H-cluster maturation GTPase HydF
MIKSPKSLRLQIGIFGRTNVGKSSFLNMIANQDVAVTSEIPGTTTDVVEKSMELLPIGPVTFLDTAGINDITELSAKRIERAKKIFDRADCAVLIAEPDNWGEYEEMLAHELNKRDIPYIIAINKIDLKEPNNEFLKNIKTYTKRILLCSSEDLINRNNYIINFKNELIKILPDDFIKPQPLLNDLINPGDIVVLIVPIDIEAPKGRIILPQVQAIRDALDGDAICIITKETDYSVTLSYLNKEPALVVCDSQVVDRMVAETPSHIKCTTFSILFSRYKGDLYEEVKGVKALNNLTEQDKIMIAETCSHHPMEDDIGRVKIPKWLNEFAGKKLNYEVACGRDYPGNLKEFKVIIHCGACMLTRNEKLIRIEKAKINKVPITNYGIAISHIHGVLERVLSPFPEIQKILKTM